MVNEAKTAELTDDTKVVLTDEYGDYLTEKYKLDRGEADPNRYPTSRLTKLFDKKSKDDDK
jgi:hypothetical protein